MEVASSLFGSLDSGSIASHFLVASVWAEVSERFEGKAKGATTTGLTEYKAVINPMSLPTVFGAF